MLKNAKDGLYSPYFPFSGALLHYYKLKSFFPPIPHVFTLYYIHFFVLCLRPCHDPPLSRKEQTTFECWVQRQLMDLQFWHIKGNLALRISTINPFWLMVASQWFGRSVQSTTERLSITSFATKVLLSHKTFYFFMRDKIGKLHAFSRNCDDT